MAMMDWMEPWASAAMAWDIRAVSCTGPAAWAQRRDQRLHGLLDMASQRSKIYAGAPVRSAGAMDRLARWPVAHKIELMRGFDDWVTDPAVTRAALRAFMSDPGRIGQWFGGRAMAWESSGSSGEPAVFVHDAQAIRVYDLLECLRRPARWLAQPWLAPWTGAEPLAFVGATQGHFASVCSIERLRHTVPWLAQRMRSFSFMQPLPALVDQLNDFQPTTLASYPSTALMLAEEAAAGRLTIPLRAVWTGGETLTTAVRQSVQSSFGAPVINSYGASEFLALACDCERGALHFNSDWAILEPVDDRYRAVEPGHFGSTALLTNLANHLQPLIRYDIGDRVRFDPRPCACGSPLPVIEVEGRTDDSLLLRGAHGQRVRVPPLAVVSLLENDAGVFDFQLIQADDHRLRLNLAGTGEAAERQLRKASELLSAFLRSHGCDRVKLTGRCGIHEVPGRSGKVQRVIAAPMREPALRTRVARPARRDAGVSVGRTRA